MFLVVIFRLVKIRFAVKLSNLPVFRFAVIFNIFKTTRFFIYRFFQYSINLPVYSVSRYIYRFSICLDVIFCSLRWDCLLASTYHGRGLNAMGGISNCFSTLKKLDSCYSEPWTMKDGLILVNTLQSCLE